MKPQVYTYVKQCKVCQQHNIIPVQYTKGHFEVPKSPMEFISMDLIGEFPKSSKGNSYAHDCHMHAYRIYFLYSNT